MRKILKFLGLIKLTYYRLIGVKVKFDYTVFFHPKAKIINSGKGGQIKFGRKTNILKNVTIKIEEEAKIQIEHNVSILENTYIEAGKSAKINIKEGTFFNRDCKIIAMQEINIGKNIAIGPNVSFFDHDHIVKANVKQNWNEFKSDEINIEDNVWIGARSILLPGSSGSIILRKSNVRHNCVIAAGSIIKEEIPENTICYHKRENVYKAIEK